MDWTSCMEEIMKAVYSNTGLNVLKFLATDGVNTEITELHYCVQHFWGRYKVNRADL